MVLSIAMVLSLTILEICSFNYGRQDRGQHLILPLEVEYGRFPLQSLYILFKISSNKGVKGSLKSLELDMWGYIAHKQHSAIA